MASKMKNMLSSNVHNGIPLKLPSHKARILQMEMKLISSTPIRNSETRNNVDESAQLGSPIARINSADVSNNENQLKEIIPSKTYSDVKSNTSAEYKNINNPKNLPGHVMVIYSSDDDDLFIVKKKLSKETNRKRKVVKEDSDSDISPKYTKHDVSNVHIDKVDHVQENNKDKKLINKKEMNTNEHLSNEISVNAIEISNKQSNKNIEKHKVDDNKTLKRKNAKKKKADDIINVKNTEIKPKEIILEDDNISVLKTKKTKYSSKKSPKNKINKETTNKKILQQKNLKLNKSVTFALHLHSADSENNLVDNRKKPKLQSNKKKVTAQIVVKNKNETKENKTDHHSEKDTKRKVKQNLKKNVGHKTDHVKETSQESAIGTRKTSRQHIPSQPYWLTKSSNYTDDDSSQSIKDDNTKEQISKNTENKSVPSKTKIPKLKQQKQTKPIDKESLSTNILMQIKSKTSVQLDLNSDNLHTNPNNDLHLNRTHNSEEVTQNQNTDLDSRNNDSRTEANILQEKEKQTKLITTNEVKESLDTNTLSVKSKSPVTIKSKTNKQDLNSDNLHMNPDDMHSNGTHNPEENGSKKVTQSENTDLDNLQTKANTLQEKEKQTKQKSSNSSSRNKQKNSSSNVVDKQTDNLSNESVDMNVDPQNNIPFDTLIDFPKENTSKSANNSNAEGHNCENIIDKFSFKEIALAQRCIADMEHRKQFEVFGKFPNKYHPQPHDSNLSIGINISNSNFISGVLEIVPSGKKPREYPKKNHMFFFVLEGCAEVCVGNASKILRIGDSFFVPSNTPYYIINQNSTKRLLMLFTKHAAS